MKDGLPKKGSGMDLQSSSLEISAAYFQKNYQKFLEDHPEYTFSFFAVEGYSLIDEEEEVNVQIGKKTLYDTFPIQKWHDAYFSSFSLQGVKHLYIFGLGMGYSYFSLLDWLHEKERKLTFLEEDRSLFLSFLHTSWAKQILEDERVEIFLCQDEKLPKPPVTDAVEVIKAPYINQDRKFDAVRIQLLENTTLSEALYLDRLYSHIPFSHFVSNQKIFQKAFYPHKWKGAFKEIPAIICGAGPSLEKDMPLLSTLSDKALLFAGGSAITVLAAQQIFFHFAIAVDPNLEEYYRLKPAFYPERPFLFNFRTSPQVFDLLHAEFGYIRSMMGQIVDLWLEEQVGFEKELIGENLSDEALSVTTLSMATAHFLGCNPIIFSGVDLAYTEQRHYAKGVDSNRVSMASFDTEVKAENKRSIAEGKKGKVLTSVKWQMEAKCIDAYAKMHPERSFIDASSDGLAFSYLPSMSLEEVERKWLGRSFDYTGYIHSKIQQEETLPSDKYHKAIQSLQQSLWKVNELAHDILQDVTEKKSVCGKGVALVAQLEEEITYQLIFYDTLALLRDRYPEIKVWEHFAKMTSRFYQTICQIES